MPLNDAHGTSPNPTTLVTGAGGFIGSRVVAELMRRGVHVTAVTCNSTVATRARMPMADVVSCDLLNTDQLRTMVAGIRPATCIHCAWDVAGEDYVQRASNQRWVQASLHLARCLEQHGCDWLGVCGTHIESHGSHAATPLPNRYAAAKATLRNRLLELTPPHMAVCWWRIFQPYGPGERPERFVPSMFEALASGEQFTVRQPTAKRDFIHIDDVATAIAISHERRLGGVFDLGSGELVTLQAVAELASRELNAAGQLLFAAVACTDEQIRDAADLAPFTALTGWRPRISLDEGFRRLSEQSKPTWRAIA